MTSPLRRVTHVVAKTDWVPSEAKGMKLQQSPSFTIPNWQFVAGSEATNQMMLPIGSSNAFFRLVEP